VFRTGYMIQIGITLAGFLAGALYFLFSDEFKHYGKYISIFLIIFGLLSVYYLFLQYLIKINVDDRGIHFKHIMKNRQTYIPYEQIKKIHLDTFQIENLNGPLTEAIPEVNIETSDNQNFIISSGIYANFHHLILKILENYNRLQDQRIEELAKKILTLHLKNHERRKKAKH